MHGARVLVALAAWLLLGCAHLERESPTTASIVIGLRQPDPEQQGVRSLFESEAALQRSIEAGDVADSAVFREQRDGALRTSMVINARSGDWSHSLEYRFRSDGIVSSSVSTLSTFHAYHADFDRLGPVSRTIVRAYDRCGRQIKSTTGPLLVLEDRREAPPGTSLMNHEEPIVRSSADLPFAALLRRDLRDKAMARLAGCGHEGSVDSMNQASPTTARMIRWACARGSRWQEPHIESIPMMQELGLSGGSPRRGRR